jgi:hypothetical protein
MTDQNTDPMALRRFFVRMKISNGIAGKDSIVSLNGSGVLTPIAWRMAVIVPARRAFVAELVLLSSFAPA